MNAATLPAGITSFEPVPYGYRRWNGGVWCDAWVDTYNRELRRIEQRHAAGYPTEALVNGLYNLANGFDASQKDVRRNLDFRLAGVYNWRVGPGETAQREGIEMNTATATATPALYVPTVSGLWGHSHDTESDLMKQFVVECKTPSGWMGVKSYQDRVPAEVHVSTGNQLGDTEYRVYDQFA